jgi:hypothetical protein
MKWLNIENLEVTIQKQEQEIENLKLLMISPSTIAEISHDIENLKMVQTEHKFIINSYIEDFLKINMQSTQQIQKIKKDVEEQKTTISGISILQEEIQKQLVENIHSITKDLSVFKNRYIQEWNGLDIRLEEIQSKIDILAGLYTEISKSQEQRDIEKTQEHSNLIKEGLEKTKEQGKVLGAPKKITPTQVKKVKKLLTSGVSHRDIRDKLNISIGSINKIKKEN